jgi:hypothetical protein
MQITISFRPGFDVKGVVLSQSGARLRVAMQNWDDAAEFQCRHGQWFSENRDPVDIAWQASCRSASPPSLIADGAWVRSSSRVN